MGMKAESEVKRGVWGQKRSDMEEKDLGVQEGVWGLRSLGSEEDLRSMRGLWSVEGSMG